MKNLLPLVKSLLGAGLLAVTAVTAHADNILLDDGFEDIVNFQPQILSPDLQYSPLFDNSGETFNLDINPPDAPTSNFVLASNGWNENFVDPNNYLTFTLTANSTVSWDKVSFDIANLPNTSANPGDVGPTNFVVRSSVDGFDENLLSGTIGSSFQTETLDQDTTLTTGDSIEYRIYILGATDVSDLALVDNLIVAQSVPEPSSGLLSLLAFSCLAGVVLVRRVRARA